MLNFLILKLLPVKLFFSKPEFKNKKGDTMAAFFTFKESLSLMLT